MTDISPPNDGHLAPQNIDELRKFINTRQTKDLADSCHTPVDWVAYCASHSKFKNSNRFIVTTRYCFPDENWSPRVKAYCQRGQQQNWRKQNETHGRQDDVDYAFGPLVQPGYWYGLA
jgi:hypothetical protein